MTAFGHNNTRSKHDIYSIQKHINTHYCYQKVPVFHITCKKNTYSNTMNNYTDYQYLIKSAKSARAVILLEFT